MRAGHPCHGGCHMDRFGHVLHQGYQWDGTIGPRTLALANYDPDLVGTADVCKNQAQISTGPADAPDVTFEARWARATASARASVVLLVPRRPVEHSNNVSSSPPHPSEVPLSQARPEIAHVPELAGVAKLPSAAAPVSLAPGTPPLPPKLIAKLANSVPLPPPHPAKHESPLPGSARLLRRLQWLRRRGSPSLRRGLLRRKLTTSHCHCPISAAVRRFMISPLAPSICLTEKGWRRIQA